MSGRTTPGKVEQQWRVTCDLCGWTVVCDTESQAQAVLGAHVLTDHAGWGRSERPKILQRKPLTGEAR